MLLAINKHEYIIILWHIYIPPEEVQQKAEWLAEEQT